MIESTFRLPRSPRAFRDVAWKAVFSEHGLRQLSLLGRDDSLKADAVRDPRLSELKERLCARLRGERADYDWSAFDLSGRAPFSTRVWKAMREIPFGETATYAEVATAAGSPLAFRACGQACGANPILVFIPCHRVVGASGLGGFGCGLEWKRHLLGSEGHTAL